MKPAKRYASPASAVPDILIIRALENRFGNLVPYQHRYCLLWCAHTATLSGFLKLPTLSLLISDDRFIEHVNCDPDNECVSRSSWRLLKCTCLNKMFLFIWSKYVWIWFAFETNDLRCGNARYLNTRKHMRKLNIRNSRTSGACRATLDEVCLLSEKKCLVEFKTQARSFP